MEPQHPPEPVPATHTNHSHPPPHSSPNAAAGEHEYTYSEKDAYSQQQLFRAERGSKRSSSNGRGRDSVISHPFSPKQSYPPSPSSSISSAGGRKHCSITEIQAASTPIDDGQSIRRPPQAHLDSEKYGYDSSRGPRSHRNSASARAANDAVYDQGEYHEKAPEEKAWQILVGDHLGTTYCVNANYSFSSFSLAPALCFPSSSLSGPWLRCLYRSR
jgi:hypothetical protein